MDPNFRLIKLVDPSKSLTKIKDKFAKLTLSTHKQRELAAKQCEDHEKHPTAHASHLSRKLFDDFLTDDDSDSEAEALNRIFRSRTTAGENGAKMAPMHVPQRRSKSFSQRLELSDSDETNLSLEEGQNDPRLTSGGMDKLQVSPSQPQESSSKLLPSSTAAEDDDIPVHQISSRLSSLALKARTEPVTSSSGDRQVKDDALENIFKQQVELKVEQRDESPSNRRVSILTISSSPTSPISLNDDKEAADSDVVVISETEEEDDTSDDSYPVSAMRESHEPNLISNTMRDRLDAFFENIPSLASDQGPENILPHKRSLDKSGDRSIYRNEYQPEESIEIAETSSESELVQEVAARSADVAMDDITPTKKFHRPIQKGSVAESPQITVAQSLRKPRTPSKCETPTSVEKQTTPKKLRTPRKIISKPGNTASEVPVVGKKPQTPRKAVTPKDAVARSSPRKPRTPRKPPTPRVRNKADSPLESPPKSKGPILAEEPQPVPVQAVHASSPPARPSDEDSSRSPEYRIEKINISATIKIRLQFNDELLASVQSSPFTSSSSSKLPRLTESEETVGNPPARNVEEDVRTPENLKQQRSGRDQNTLTVVDITKSGLANKSTTADRDIERISEQSDELSNHLSSGEGIAKPSSSRESIHEPPDAKTVQDGDGLAIDESAEAQSASTPVRSAAPEKSSSPEDEAAIEVDDAAQSLLDKLYGDEWKTPAVVKSLKKANSTRLGINRVPTDESLMDFTKFHKNIRCDLESTRLLGAVESAKKTGSTFKVPATERRVRPTKKEVAQLSASERKPRRQDKVPTAFERARQICDSDSSDSDFNASSDESWNDAFSHSSSDDDDDDNNGSGTEIQPPKTRRNNTNKTNKKKSSNDDIIYLDLSTDVVKVQETYESPCANQDEKFQQRLKELLDTYKCPDKKKIEATPQNTKIKRKLFTPRFGEEDEASPVTPIRNDVHALDNDDGIVSIKAPLPPMFEPINKHLESVKTGKLIFATPKTSKKNKENQPTLVNGESPRTQPRKASSQREENLARALLSAPCDKYGFLQSLDVTVAKKFCHPDALKYRDNYKANKQELAEKLYGIYNTNVFNNDLDVALVWNKKLLNTAGRCSCSTKGGKRFCRIELSDKVLTSADRLRCTLIHELCHAATWLYTGEHGHGATWKKWARRANGIFPELPKIGVCHEYDIDYKYTYKCTLCNAKSHAHSKSKKVENIRCAYCHGAIEVFLNKKDKDGNVLPTPVREATGFAKFVKDNYKKHKHPDLKHAEVMRLLSNEFASLNVDEKK